MAENKLLYKTPEFIDIHRPEEISYIEIYFRRFGEDGLNRLDEVLEKIKKGRLTFRQAASTLGITYYEFMMLIEEKGI
ncbi:MAG: hypothetical protein ACE5J9_03100 [Methanosarcinales archaeon]